MLDTQSTVVQIGIIVTVAIVLYIILNMLKNTTISFIEKSKESPYIFKGSKNAKRSLV
jgi:hypothetical protein